jgi:predicted transcriptional regulator YdeE
MKVYIRSQQQNIWQLQQAKMAAPDFERCDDRFDPTTGEDPIEIWFPTH